MSFEEGTSFPAGYTCPQCALFVPYNTYHACPGMGRFGSLTSPPPAAQDRIAAALERIAASLERTEHIEEHTQEQTQAAPAPSVGS